MHDHLAWPRIRKRVRTILMIVVIVGSIRIVGRPVVQGPESASAANRNRRSRSGGGAAATGEWTTGSVRRVDDRGAPLCHPRHGTDQRAAEDESSVAKVPASHRQLLASEHQHRHRHARRAALPAVARETRRRAHGEPGDRRSAHPMPARLLRACVRAPSLSEVRPDAGSAGDAERVQRHLPSGLHGRPAAAGGSESVVAGLFDGHVGRRHAGDRHASDFATTCGSTGTAA